MGVKSSVTLSMAAARFLVRDVSRSMWACWMAEIWFHDFNLYLETGKQNAKKDFSRGSAVVEVSQTRHLLSIVRDLGGCTVCPK